jgi:hypothetical protein
VTRVVDSFPSGHQVVHLCPTFKAFTVVYLPYHLVVHVLAQTSRLQDLVIVFRAVTPGPAT